MARSTFQIVFEAVTRDLDRGLKKTSGEADKASRALGKTKHASLEVREAALKVEQAQQRAARATSRYGAESLQAQRESLKLERAQRNLDRAGAATTKRLHGMASAAKAAAGAFAGFAIVDFLKDSAQAAGESEKSQAKLQAQLKASGISYRAHAGEIDRVIQKTSQLAALDDEDLQDAFTNIVRVTGNVNQSLKLTGLAADFARAKHIDVAKAGEIVGKVAGGNTGILSRYGFQIQKGATSAQALAALQAKFAGQAAAYGKTSAGAYERLGVSFENLKETVGAALAPALSSAANALSKFITDAQNGTGAGGRFAAAVGRIVAAVKGAISLIGQLARGFREGHAPAVALTTALAGVTAGIVAFKVTAAAVRGLAALRGAMIAVTAVMAANPIIAVATAITALGVAMVIAYKKSETFRTIVNGAFRGVRLVVGTEIGLIVKQFDLFLGGLSSIMSAAGSLPVVGGKFRAAARGIDAAREKLRDTVDAIKGVKREGENVTVKVRVKTFGAGVLDDLSRTLKGLQNGDGVGVTLPGMPSGGGGGSLKGANRALAPFASAAGRYGLHVTSGSRPGAITSSGNVSYHSSGEAIDVGNGKGPDAAKLRFFQMMKLRFGSRLAELIYTPGGAGIKNGRPFFYSGKVAADHYDHVHVALDLGRPGVGIGDGHGRAPFTGDGPGTVRGRVSTFGPPLEGAGTTASGMSSSAAGIALNINPGTDSGWNNAITNRWVQTRQKFRVTIGGHSAVLPVIDKGPAGFTKRAIDVTGAGARALGINPANFPTDAVGTAVQVGGSLSGGLTAGGGSRSGSRGSGSQGSSIAKLVGGVGRVPGPRGSLIGSNKSPDRLPSRGYGGNGANSIGGNQKIMPFFPGDVAVSSGAPAGSEAADGPSILDYANARIAMAQLTPGTEDDLSAYENLKQVAQQGLADAQASGDPRAIIEAANALKGVQDSIDQLKGAIDDTAARQQALTDALAEKNANDRKLIALAQSQPTQLIGALVAALNGGIGERVFSGGRTPLFAGQGVRY